MSDRKREAGEERKEERQLVISGWVVLLLFVTDWDGGMGEEGERRRDFKSDGCVRWSWSRWVG